MLLDDPPSCIPRAKLVWVLTGGWIAVILNPSRWMQSGERIGAPLSDKRPLTPGYIFFYILFLPDTWQVLIGVLASGLVTPSILSPDMALPARVMVYLMMATIGYAASRRPARGITRLLKKWILGDRHLK